jgi:hypothetical protein
VRWAGKETFWQALADRNRLAARDRLPELEPFGWIIEAFWELATCRQWTMAGPAPIPATAIWAYADRYDCPPWFSEVIERTDLAWLRMQSGGERDEGN